MTRDVVSNEANATNDQLLKIIEQQQETIQALQTNQARLYTEKQILTDRVGQLERELAQYRPTRSISGEEAALPSDSWLPEQHPSTPTLLLPVLPSSPVLLPGASPSLVDIEQETQQQTSDGCNSHAERPLPPIPTTDSDHQDQHPTTGERWLARVVGNTIKPNEKGKLVCAFIVSVGRRPEGGEDGFLELWRVEKMYSDFLALDTKLKASGDPVIMNNVAKLPDRQLFSNNRPLSKMDQRKAALDHYLQQIVSLPHHDVAGLEEFLSSDLVESARPHMSGRQEGYLFKRGKNFGGWKARYFILDGASLDYYETMGGNHLGTIKLQELKSGATVFADDSSGTYRHAFVVLEQKKSGSNGVVRHMFYANSDDERDRWIQALEHAASQANPTEALKTRKVSKADIRPIAATPLNTIAPEHGDNLWKLTSTPAALPSLTLSSSQDTIVESPTRLDPPHVAIRRNSTTNLQSRGTDEAQSPTLSAMHEGFRSSDNLLGANEGRLKHMSSRVSFWGKKVTSGINISGRLSPSSSTDTSRMSSIPTGFRNFLSKSCTDLTDISESSTIFGVSLDEAVHVSRIKEGYELPAIVYRCIEYLDAKDAVCEEGIYRLSGSATEIQRLKMRFSQGDFNLLESNESFDIHAVAGILKLWLRELPTHVLTRELLPSFLHVTDLIEHKDRVSELGRLVSLLPLTNYTLLRALMVHLICVVQHAEVNKMNIRNVGIVFSPTLRIPPTIFYLFLTEFEYIFWTNEDGRENPDEPTLTHKDVVHQESERSNRNSVNYMGNAPHTMVNLEKAVDDRPRVEQDDVDDLVEQDYQIALQLDLNECLTGLAIGGDSFPPSPTSPLVPKAEYMFKRDSTQDQESKSENQDGDNNSDYDGNLTNDDTTDNTTHSSLPTCI